MRGILGVQLDARAAQVAARCAQKRTQASAIRPLTLSVTASVNSSLSVPGGPLQTGVLFIWSYTPCRIASNKRPKLG